MTKLRIPSLSCRATLMILSVFILLSIPAYAQQQPNSTSSLCGNGRFDPGEECDPMDISASSPDCCTNTCRIVPDRTVCGNGAGVCRQSRCLNRSDQCANFDTSVLTVPLAGQENTVQIGGPFQTCFPVNNTSQEESQSKTIDSLLESGDVTTSTLLPQLLPPFFASQSQCTVACQGSLVVPPDQTQPTQPVLSCLNFTRFQNLPKQVDDFLGCVVDQTVGVNLTRVQLSGGSDKNLMSLLQPGVCIGGQCSADQCRASRCNNNGDCVLSGAAMNFMRSALKFEKLNPNGTVDNSLVQCQCDNGFRGRSCQFGLNEPCLDCSPETQSSSDLAYTSGQYWRALVAAVLGTFFATLLLFAMITLLKKSRDRTEKSAAVSDDTPKSPFSPRPLSDIVVAKDSDSQYESGAPTLDAPRTTNITPEATELSAGQAAAVAGGAAAVAGAAIALAATKSDDNTETARSDLPTLPTEEPPLLNEAHELPAPYSATQMPENYLRAAFAYQPRLADELQLLPNDMLYLVKSYDDGWARAYNLRTGKEGVFPLSFTKRMSVPAPQQPLPQPQTDAVATANPETSVDSISELARAAENAGDTTQGTDIIQPLESIVEEESEQDEPIGLDSKLKQDENAKEPDADLKRSSSLRLSHDEPKA